MASLLLMLGIVFVGIRGRLMVGVLESEELCVTDSPQAGFVGSRYSATICRASAASPLSPPI